MVYGVLGKLPLDIFIKKRTIGYWARILVGKESKLTKVTYKWIEFIKDILEDCNLNEIWVSQNFRSVNWLKSTVFNKLKSNFIERWSNEIQNMSSCDLYIQFKTNFKFERYLHNFPDFPELLSVDLD